MSDEFTKEETERRARAAAWRLLNTPPQPRTKPKTPTDPARPAPTDILTDEDFAEWLDREMAEFRSRPFPLLKAALAKNPPLGANVSEPPRSCGSEEKVRLPRASKQTSRQRYRARSAASRLCDGPPRWRETKPASPACRQDRTSRLN